MSWPVDVKLVKVPKLAYAAARVSNRTIYWLESYPVDRATVAHELRHIFDRHRLGWRFLGAYLLGWVLAGFNYHRNRFERWAREAETDPHYLAWADDVIEAAE